MPNSPIGTTVETNTTATVPFNVPWIAPRQQEYMVQSVQSGHTSGDGSFTKRCQVLLEDLLAGSRVLLTTSCTHALELSALLLNIGAGDEVIVPSFTFVSTANAFVLRGAKPVIVDIRPDTLNLDEALLERAISARTRAIIPVHYAGVGCEMESIERISKARGVPIIEDNAHGFLGSYKGKQLGTFGCMSALSFHETKNVQCGEGGALVLNDQTLAERAEIIREKGTNRNNFFRGQVDKYSWVDVGSSFVPSDILASILLAQLEELEDIQSRRRRIWHQYSRQLLQWAAANDVTLPAVPHSCLQPYHLFYLLMPSHEARERLLTSLKVKGVSSAFHYVPLHVSKMAETFGYGQGDCPVAERVSECLVRLPFYTGMTEKDQEKVISAVLEFKV